MKRNFIFTRLICVLLAVIVMLPAGIIAHAQTEQPQAEYRLSGSYNEDGKYVVELRIPSDIYKEFCTLASDADYKTSDAFVAALVDIGHINMQVVAEPYSFFPSCFIKDDNSSDYDSVSGSINSGVSIGALPDGTLYSASYEAYKWILNGSDSYVSLLQSTNSAVIQLIYGYFDSSHNSVVLGGSDYVAVKPEWKDTNGDPIKKTQTVDKNLIGEPQNTTYSYTVTTGSYGKDLKVIVEGISTYYLNDSYRDNYYDETQEYGGYLYNMTDLESLISVKLGSYILKYEHNGRAPANVYLTDKSGSKLEDKVTYTLNSNGIVFQIKSGNAAKAMKKSTKAEVTCYVRNIGSYCGKSLYSKYNDSPNYSFGNPAAYSVKVTKAKFGGKLSDFDVKVYSAEYTGKNVTPEANITDNGYQLRKGIDYTVSYKNNKSIGTATATIKGKGIYSGTVSKSFNINPPAPQNVTVTAKTDGKITIKWDKVKAADGYQIFYSENGADYTLLKSLNSSKNSFTTQLDQSKCYDFKLQAYKKVGKTKLTSKNAYAYYDVERTETDFPYTISAKKSKNSFDITISNIDKEKIYNAFSDNGNGRLYVYFSLGDYHINVNKNQSNDYSYVNAYISNSKTGLQNNIKVTNTDTSFTISIPFDKAYNLDLPAITETFYFSVDFGAAEEYYFNFSSGNNSKTNPMMSWTWK